MIEEYKAFSVEGKPELTVRACDNHIVLKCADGTWNDDEATNDIAIWKDDVEDVIELLQTVKTRLKLNRKHE